MLSTNALYETNNMFMVVNKDKIISYIVSVSTVVILFVMAYVITDNKNELLQTSVNTTTTSNIDYNLDSDNEEELSLNNLD